MKQWRTLLLCLFTLPVLNAGDWTKITSPNFTLYSTYAPDDARRTLETFEQTRDFFRQVKAFAVTSEAPLVLMGFGTEREYRPYSMGRYVRAYYLAAQDEEYIVMSEADEEGKRIAIHEYVHSLVRHSGMALPAWLNEGLAEVYSGMEARDGKVLLGKIPSDRAYTLGSSNWLRLREVIEIGPGSPAYNEAERVGPFYAQSCLLVHMLMLGDGYSSKFSTFLERVSASGSTQAAFADVYGKPLAEVERDLRTYFQQATIGGATYRADLRKVTTGAPVAASEVEVALKLAKLLIMLKRPEEALHQLRILPAELQTNVEVQEALADTEWRAGHTDAALEHFQAILSSGAATWKTYWDYAGVLDSNDRDRTAEFQALRKALGLKPDLQPAHLLLGTRLCETGQFAEGLEQLKQAGTVEPERAATLYLMMAYAALELRQLRDAREYAQSAKRFARKPDDAAHADEILKATADVGSATEVRTPSTTDGDAGRPILRRQTKKQEPLN